ncbi:hypothetical protein MNBD_GAMMA06-2179 [hydrothermal vent metagenome]|uniref:Uncharacterized protein n=1 Tax=hydrothermal vent metagenome TaxID=652676 RepID=A0A3B0W7C8_9ZZZZ
MKANNKIISKDLFTSDDENIDDVLFFNEPSSLNSNAARELKVLYLLYSVFSIFVLSFISILFFFGIETDLLQNVVTTVLSAAVVITAFALLYATAKIIE